MCLGQSPRDCAGFVIASNLTNAQFRVRFELRQNVGILLVW
jgi:hypothetical protein